jgi:hypothetical protein
VAIQNKLINFPERTAPLIVGFTDVQEIMGILRAEIESDLIVLNSADYLQVIPEDVVRSLPFDEETSKLIDTLTFGGQDLPAFLSLVGRCLREVLARIGRERIAAVRNDPEATLHAVTGQVTPAAEEAQREIRTAAPAAPAGKKKPTEKAGPRKRGKRGKNIPQKGKIISKSVRNIPPIAGS